MRGVGEQGSGRVLIRAALCATALGFILPAVAADALYYAVEDDRVIVTNVPSRPDLRPLPGFSNPARKVRAAVALPATPYDAFIERLGVEVGLSPDLIKAVAMVESAFDPRARSPKGALGLMQLMPATARRYGVKNPYDPLENLRGGARHLRDLLDEHDGDLTLALAAYNAGSGAVRRYGGVPAYAETRAYVRKVQDVLDGKGRRVTRSRPMAESAEVRLERRADGTVALVN